MSHPPENDSPRLIDYVSILLVAIAVVVVVAGNAGRSFWLDETAYVWAAKKPFGEVLDRAARYLGQTPLYVALLQPLSHHLNASELILRLPSLLFGLLTVASLSLFLKKRFGWRAASYAGLLLLFQGGVLFHALNATPYALSLFAATATGLAMLSLMETSNGLSWCAFILSGTLTVYSHYLYALVLIPAFLCLSLTSARRLVVPAYAIIGLASLAALEQLTGLMRGSGGRAFTSMPTLLDPLAGGQMLRDILIFLPMLAAAGYGRARITREEIPGISASERRLFAGALLWYISTPLLNLALSHGFQSSTNLNRYWEWRIPAAALITGVGLARLEPLRFRGVIAFILSISFLALSVSGNIDKLIGREDWRSAAHYSQMACAAENRILILYTAHSVTQDLSWLIEPDKVEMAASPLSIYPISGELLLLPYSLESPAQAPAFITSKLSSISGSACVLLAIRGEMAPGMHEFLERALRASGLTRLTEAEFEEVHVEAYVPQSHAS